MRLVERLAERATTNQTQTLRLALLGLRAEIAEAFAHGASKRDVWRLLVAEGRIACSYQVFTAQTRAIKRRAPNGGRRTPSEQLVTVSPAPPPSPAPVSDGKLNVSRPPVVNVEELI